jgi:excisionase family DNA binding protein
MARKSQNNQKATRERGISNPLCKRLYTLKEAAQYLGRSEWSMRDLIWGGKIPVVKQGENRKIYLDILDLNEFVNRNKSIYQ